MIPVGAAAVVRQAELHMPRIRRYEYGLIRVPVAECFAPTGEISVTLDFGPVSLPLKEAG